MVVLAISRDRNVSAREIAAQFGLSSAHLAKVMQRLAKAGLVSSSRGPAGGFALTKPAADITLLEIYEAVEGDLQDHGCLLSASVCPGGACLLGDTIEKVNSQVRNTMATKSLAQLARSYQLRRG